MATLAAGRRRLAEALPPRRPLPSIRGPTWLPPPDIGSVLIRTGSDGAVEKRLNGGAAAAVTYRAERHNNAGSRTSPCP